MRFTRSMLIATLTLLPAFALAQPRPVTPSAQKPKPAAKPAKAATHSTSGVIRSIDGTTLVIAKNAKTTTTETFEMTSDTARKGELVVGAKVGVRYTTAGGRNVATAVSVSGKSTHASLPKSSL